MLRVGVGDRPARGLCVFPFPSCSSLALIELWIFPFILIHSNANSASTITYLLSGFWVLVTQLEFGAILGQEKGSSVPSGERCVYSLSFLPLPPSAFYPFLPHVLPSFHLFSRLIVIPHTVSWNSHIFSHRYPVLATYPQNMADL